MSTEHAEFKKLVGVIEVLSARHVLASSSVVQPLRNLLHASVLVHDLAAIKINGTSVDGRHVRGAALTPTSVLFYQLTSGSTGTPKCIPERHCAIISHIRHSAQHCAYQPSDVTLNWLPFEHVVPMLTYHLADVYLGRLAIQLPTNEVLASPIMWLRAMAKHRVTHSWSPNFGFKLAALAVKNEGLDVFDGDLSAIKLLMNAGEQVTTEVCDGFLRATGLPSNVMQPAFGMAEVCTCMTYCNDYEQSALLRIHKVSMQDATLRFADGTTPSYQVATFVNLGPVSPGVEMRIAASGGSTVLRERQIGHLQIRGPCVMMGYHNNPKANAECFPGGDWFDSGDLGFIHDGQLVLTGRAKEMIIAYGANYYCYEIEDVVSSGVPGTVAARVATTSVRDLVQGTELLAVFFVPASADGLEQLHAHGVLLPELAQLCTAVRSAVSSGVGLAPRFVVPVSDAGFHRTQSGKIQRGKFKKELLQGVYRTAVTALDACFRPATAFPNFFSRPTLMRKELVLGRDARESQCMVLVAPRQMVQQLSSCICQGRPPVSSSPIIIASYDEASLTENELAASLQALHARGGGTIVFALLLGSDGKMASRILDVARAFQRANLPPTAALTMLCLTYEATPGFEEELGYHSDGAAFSSSLCKALAAECPALRRAAVVAVPRAASVAAISEHVCTESGRGSVLDTEVAYDTFGRRYVRRFTSIGDQLVSEAIEGGHGSIFEAGGVFVVTGGLGAIGRGVVQLLLDRVPSVRILILGSRSKAQAATQLSALGWAGDSRIYYESVSLGRDYSALRAALQHVIGGEWPLRAVLHLAGGYERALLASLSSEALASGTAAKVQGAVHLHEVARELGQRPIFVHFGSLVSVLVGAGLGSYAASNAFLEWFSAFQRDTYGLDSRCYVWTRWAGTGLGTKFELPDDVLRNVGGLETITASRGHAILRTLLERCPSHRDVCIGINPLEPVLGCRYVDGPLQLSAPCVFYTTERSPTPELCMHRCVYLPGMPRLPDGTIDVSALREKPLAELIEPGSSGPMSDTAPGDVEVLVLQALREELGSVTKDMDLMQAGVDSVSAVGLMSRLGKGLGVGPLPPTLLYSARTPRAIAEHVLGRSRPGPAKQQEGIGVISTSGAALIRCLVLHGEASDASLQKLAFEATGWIDELSPLVEFIFINAPHECAPRPELFEKLHAAGFYSKSSYHSWSLEDIPPSKSRVMQSIEAVQRELTEHAPIHAIAGFCLGSVVAAVVAGKQNLPYVNISGGGPASAFGRGVDDVDALVQPIRAQSLHLISPQDMLIPQGRLFDLPARCMCATLVQHDRGHVVPPLFGRTLDETRAFFGTLGGDSDVRTHAHAKAGSEEGPRNDSLSMLAAASPNASEEMNVIFYLNFIVLFGVCVNHLAYWAFKDFVAPVKSQEPFFIPLTHGLALGGFKRCNDMAFLLLGRTDMVDAITVEWLRGKIFRPFVMTCVMTLIVWGIPKYALDHPMQSIVGNSKIGPQWDLTLPSNANLARTLSVLCVRVASVLWFFRTMIAFRCMRALTSYYGVKPKVFTIVAVFLYILPTRKWDHVFGRGAAGFCSYRQTNFDDLNGFLDYTCSFLEPRSPNVAYLALYSLGPWILGSNTVSPPWLAQRTWCRPLAALALLAWCLYALHTAFFLSDTAFSHSQGCMDQTTLALHGAGVRRQCCVPLYSDFMLGSKYGIARVSKYHLPVLSIAILVVFAVGIITTRLLHVLCAVPLAVGEHHLLTKLLALTMASVFMFVDFISATNRADPWPINKVTGELPSIWSSVVGRASVLTVKAFSLAAMAVLVPRWPSVFSRAGARPVLIFLLHNSVGFKLIADLLRMALSWAEDAWPLVLTTIFYMAFVMMVQFFFALVVPNLLTSLMATRVAFPNLLALPKVADLWSALVRVKDTPTTALCSPERIGVLSTSLLFIWTLNALPGLLGDARLMEAVQRPQEAARAFKLGTAMPAPVKTCSSIWEALHAAHSKMQNTSSAKLAHVPMHNTSSAKLAHAHGNAHTTRHIAEVSSNGDTGSAWQRFPGIGCVPNKNMSAPPGWNEVERKGKLSRTVHACESICVATNCTAVRVSRETQGKIAGCIVFPFQPIKLNACPKVPWFSMYIRQGVRTDGFSM